MTTEWLDGGGEVGAMIRARDWSATPLGPRDRWSPALCTVVNLVVASPQGMWLVWGADSILLYNDACLGAIGSRHPDLLGRSARDGWGGAWEISRAVLGASLERQVVGLRDPSGRPVEVSVIPVRDGDLVGGTLLVVRELDGSWEQLQRVSARLVHEGDPTALLSEILDVAIEITGADLGNIQTIDSTGELRIAVHRGFPPDWIEYWNRVRVGHGACGTALERAQRVVIDDVARSAVFDDRAREVQLAAGIRAVQSTPLLSRAGTPLGMISTHYKVPFRPDDRALRLVDLLARQAADFLERTRRDREVRQSEATFARILMTSVDAIVCVDPANRIVFFNHSAERMFGHTAAEMMGTALELLVPERLRAELPSRIAELLAGPDANPSALRTVVHRRKNGEEFPAAVSISRAPPGGRVALTATIRDVTGEHRWAERMRFLANESPAVLYTRAPDPPFAITFVGTNVVEHFGYSQDQLIGDATLWSNKLHPADVRRLDHALARVDATHPQLLEYRLQRPDGTYCWVHDELSRGQKPEGGVELIGFLTDISARKTLDALETRSRLEDHLLAGLGAMLDPLAYERSLADSLEWLVGELGERGELFVVELGVLARVASAPRDHSPAPDAAVPAIASQSFAEQRTLAELVVEPSSHGQRRALLVVPLRVAERCLGVLTLSSVARTYDQEDVVLVEEVARRLAGFVENAHLRKAERRATRMRDEVLGVVAHDLRSPLNTIMLQTQLIERDPTRPQTDAIRRATHRLDRMIQDLLDVARMESGQLHVIRAPVAPGPVVLESVEVHAALAAKLSVEIRPDVSGELPGVLADRDRLLQIFENLIGNAMKFTRSSGKITVGAAPEAGDVLFWVADTGCGIAADKLPRVFDRFWQEHGAKGRGAGLGLAIVKGIVEAHDGRIWVDSTLDAGTTFFFALPVAQRRS